MKIQIKISTKPVEYTKAIDILEKRVTQVQYNRLPELIWLLEHPNIFTTGSRSNENEILDKSINLIKTNRGGKITHHGPGQLICYFVLNLNKRKKDIRKFINIIEKTIIETLKDYNIKAFDDKKNIGIWVKHKNKTKKIASIGIRVSKWVAFHGFSINISNDLQNFKKIIPCGIKDKEVVNLKLIKNQSYKRLNRKILKNFIRNLEI